MKDHELRIMSKAELDHLLSSVIVMEKGYAEEASIFPFRFCPRCGCSKEYWYNHGVPYPERWETGYCKRCDFKIGESDNSPYVHCLEFRDSDYVI